MTCSLLKSAQRVLSNRILIGSTALLLALTTVPRAQPATPLEISATELRDRIDGLMVLAKQSAADSRRMDAVRVAVALPEPVAPAAADQEPPQRLGAVRRSDAAPTADVAPAPTLAPVLAATAQSVFSPVLSAIVQALILAIATLTPLAIGWAAWELRSRTGMLTKQQDASVLAAAIHNSLGAMQRQSTVSGISSAPSGIATSYVLVHAGPEAKRLGISAGAIAEKISAQLGLQAIARAGVAAATDHPVQTPGGLPT